MIDAMRKTIIEIFSKRGLPMRSPSKPEGTMKTVEASRKARVAHWVIETSRLASRAICGREAAEFDTRTPHWFGAASPGKALIISLFSREGERIHLHGATD